MSSKLKSGIFWSVVEVVIKRALDFVVKLILARLLFPEDFGVIGMATVFTSFIAVLNEAGMGLAIIQKKNIDDRHLNTVFWTNVGWSIFLYVLLSFVAAPLAADFYSQPILIKVIPILSLSILTRALNTVHMAQLKRKLQFKKIAFANNVSSIIAGVIAILMAFLDYGVWSLVANEVVAYIITVPLFYNATKWLPRLYWDKSALKEILSFGIYTTGTRVTENLISNADYLLIGKWVGSSAVGAYTLAYMMTNLVRAQITTMLDRVMYPFYSSIQDDMTKLKSYYLKIIGFYVMILYPIMLILILFGQDLIPMFFGDKWDETIIPVKLLAIAAMIDIVTSGYNLLFRSVGKPKYEFKVRQITAWGVYLPLLIAGIYYYGIIGAAAGVMLSRIISFFIKIYILDKNFEIKLKDIFIEIRLVILVCIITTFLVLLLEFIGVNTYVIFGMYLLTFISLYYYFFKDTVLKLIRRKK